MIYVDSWEELLMSLSKNLRSTVRRTLRRVEADGVRRRLVGVAGAEPAARRLVALHRELFQERNINPEHLTKRFESHVVAAARRMTARELGGISEFCRDGEPIISSFWVSKRDYLGTYMLGASQQAVHRYQWSSLYVWDAVSTALTKNAHHLDLLRGEEQYKLRWSSRVVPTHRLILGRRKASWLPYAGYHVLYSRARLYANSESAPPWVQRFVDKLRVLKHKATQLASKAGQS